MSKSLHAAQAALCEISRTYHNAIPLQAMFDACKAAALEPIQEDGTPWDGFLCGRDGRATIELAGTKRCLQVQWFKMDVTGRYEVNAYIGSRRNTMQKLSGRTIKALMRCNQKTIRGIAAKYNLTMTRVRYVREHGVEGAAFVRDWLEILQA